MAQPTIQSSFNSGEWAPHLWARTDIERYHSGAALLRNFYVDYRGGASTRQGTRYVIRGYKDSTAIRLIPFQASISLGFICEFGDAYIRFHRNGAPVLETPIAITGATQTNPCVISVVNSWSVGDWIYVTGVSGMTQLNGKYFIVHARTGTTVTLYDLFNTAVDATAYTAWSSGGTAARIYTLVSPYAAADLALLKFAQNVTEMVICHPNYVPQQLTFVSAASWTIAPITFGPTIGIPFGLGFVTSLGAGSCNYGYVVTAVDINGQESPPSDPVFYPSSLADMRTVSGTNTITWAPVTGAVSYNVYKAEIAVLARIPVGAAYGYIGNAQGTVFNDSNIAQDFSTPPPTYQNPFATGEKVASVTMTNDGTYTAVPSVTVGVSPSGHNAVIYAVLGATTIAINAAGTGFAVGDLVSIGSNGVRIKVATIGGGGTISTFTIDNRGSITLLGLGSLAGGGVPANPVAQTSTNGIGTGATFNLTWGVVDNIIFAAGDGYLSPPSIAYTASGDTATGTAVMAPASDGNPTVPGFFQQRLCLGGQTASPDTLHYSQPGDFYNYDITTPAQADDAISATIVSSQLNNIKAMIAQPSGHIIFTDGANFLVNGGGFGAAITPSSIVANPQSYNGSSDLPPIVSNYDILFYQSKGSIVRDSTYNFYANVFTGTDISVLASHLFYGHTLTEWAWAEEPYKIVWAVRNDGTLLTLTFLKEQEFTGWAHSDTTGGLFKSVATIVESASQGFQNFVYTLVQRTVRSQTVQYIEYFTERIFTNGVKDAWSVDSGIQYSGSPATQFSGAEHLAGLTVTGLADGVAITPFVMPTNGNFTLANAASKVTIGIGFTAQLQTLFIDTGQPTIQSKMKALPAVTARVTDTLGLKIGTTFSNLVTIKDLVVGNVGSMTNQVVTDLVTGDARTFIDPKWQEPGQFCIQQDLPYPASVLGVFPQIAVGDTK